MKNNFKILEQFLEDSGLKASDFYCITFYEARIALQGKFDRSLVILSGKYAEGHLSVTGYIQFDIRFNGLDIDITLT